MATSDYASPAQARLMRARAHGWKPSRMKHMPSRAVAEEFVQAKDREKERKQYGGLLRSRMKRIGRGFERMPIEQLRTREDFLRSLAERVDPNTGLPSMGILPEVARRVVAERLEPPTMGSPEFGGGLGAAVANPVRTIQPIGQPGGLLATVGGASPRDFYGAPTRSPYPSLGGGAGMEVNLGAPPSMQGYLQKIRMLARRQAARPRIGMGDQQGALARAKQTQTGRPPISRRYGFPGGMGAR